MYGAVISSPMSVGDCRRPLLLFFIAGNCKNKNGATRTIPKILLRFFNVFISFVFTFFFILCLLSHVRSFVSVFVICIIGSAAVGGGGDGDGDGDGDGSAIF